ncbi:MAG: hypothetical protein IKK57_07865 [Clostridia bacterium]|nr:hypothetical protein [Clostridia bacterium]
MPLTSYCKKCACDVPVGDFCPECGGKLAASAVRLAWCVDHVPVRDWMCWNGVMRIALPVMGVTLALTIVLEAILGGLTGLTQLLTGGLFPTLGGLSLGAAALLLLVFILQGEDLLDCVIDASGLHVQQYLPRPTALKLLLRLRSPRLLEQTDENGLLLISSRSIAWKELRRVQLWPEKGFILLYAPAWWQQLTIPCTRETWLDALEFIKNKIGKRKDVILPPQCVQTAPPRAKKPAAKKSRTQQLTIDDVPPQPLPGEESAAAPPPTDDWTQDIPESNETA